MTDRELSKLHAAVRKVLKHHNLLKVGDGVVEADLIAAVLDAAPAPVTPGAVPTVEQIEDRIGYRLPEWSMNLLLKMWRETLIAPAPVVPQKELSHFTAGTFAAGAIHRECATFPPEDRCPECRPAPAPVAQPGWALVPVEPTPEMAKASCFRYCAMFVKDYKAMIAAAPTAPAPVTEKRCPCGYIAPCVKRVPIGFCRAGVGQEGGAA
ncbi:MAG: hypothetical protein AB9M53_01110 [Leptothrix sp. (in: b-proteobacteria)]